MKRNSLGRGLSSLIDSEIESIDGSEIKNININKVEPNKDQPRTFFDEEPLEELANSIKEHGIIQPLIVQKKDDFYQIIAGERRWRAARKIKLKEVPVVVLDIDDEEKLLEMSLIENIQREDLNPIEEAKTYKKLQEKHNLTQDEIAKKVGKSRSSITNFLRLLKLPEFIQTLLYENTITTGHAKVLLSIDDDEIKQLIAEEIADKNLSIRDTKKFIEKVTSDNKDKKERKIINPIHLSIENEIKEILGTKVKIKQGKKKGKIQIDYDSKEDLERILSLIQKI